MEHQFKLLRVFIASPGDLVDERCALREVVEKIHTIFSKETDCRIELLGWEDTLPGAGRPQELINADLDKADLFIGCLWQRWGSSSGMGDKTGFEEEFDRALQRRAKSGSPEMWLFFKEVESVTRSDPGPQLQKVLAFRKQEIEAKRLLFREFHDVEAWRDMIFELLHRQMLRLVMARPVLQKDVQSTGPPHVDQKLTEAAGQSAKAESKSSSAFVSLANILRNAELRVRSAKLPTFDRSEMLAAPETVRLLLFSTATYDWYGQRIQLGVHEINSAYFHRRALTPTGIERLFLLRTVALDKSLAKPGWFWIAKSKIKLTLWLSWIAAHDSEADVRVSLIELATRIKFPLYKKGPKYEAPITQLLNAQEEISVRLAALQHLGELGREVELPLLEPLLRDDNKEVRIQAERTARLVRLRANPDRETGKSIDQRDPFDEETADIVAQAAEHISDSTLIKALSHSSGALMAVASKELARRGRISPDLARRMTECEPRNVKECGLLAQIAHGHALDTAQIKLALLNPSLIYSSEHPWWDKAESDKVISAYFNCLPEDDLWRRVYSFNDDSNLALRAIGRRFFPHNGERIRTDLLDDFQKHAQALKLKEPEMDPLLRLLATPLYQRDSNRSIESARIQLRTTAIEILADHPDVNDRELFLTFLSAEFGDAGQTVACLRGLSSIGCAEDRAEIVRLLSDTTPFIQAAAARAYLIMSPSAIVGAKDLLSEPSEYRVWAVISYSFKFGERSLWPIMDPLLHHETENIRRLVCYYVVRTFKKRAIEKLLDEYLNSGRYFYNVVTLFDRALYAPEPLWITFLQEEHDFFEKWVRTATWQWPDQ